MKVLLKGGLVDFEAPVRLRDDQRDRILKFFHDHFEAVVTKDVEEPERDIVGKEGKDQHKWTARDYLMLFSARSNEEIASKLKLETSMGPHIKRGTFVMTFLKWKREKHGNATVSEKIIQEYLDGGD